MLQTLEVCGLVTVCDLVRSLNSAFLNEMLEEIQPARLQQRVTVFHRLQH